MRLLSMRDLSASGNTGKHWIRVEYQSKADKRAYCIWFALEADFAANSCTQPTNVLPLEMSLTGSLGARCNPWLPASCAGLMAAMQQMPRKRQTSESSTSKSSCIAIGLYSFLCANECKNSNKHSPRPACGRLPSVNYAVSRGVLTIILFITLQFTVIR